MYRQRSDSRSSSSSSSSSHRRFNFVFGIVSFVTVCLIVWYCVIGYIGIKLIDKVQNIGLKTVIEEIWEGKHATEGK